MSSRWTGSGPNFGLRWGGRLFELATDSERPGLTEVPGGSGILLGLQGLAAQGRDGTGALGRSSFVSVENRLGRVEAVYSPEGWGSLRVRAAWIPRTDDVLDLEIQLQAASVGDLKAVEVLVTSDLGKGIRSRPGSDSPVVAHLIGTPAAAFSYYLEMVHPDDRSPRKGGSVPGRYALFGHDLERGVILRARLRGIWLESEPVDAEVSRLFDEFVNEPLPLGI
jgi:hypothetical protein